MHFSSAHKHISALSLRACSQPQKESRALRHRSTARPGLPLLRRPVLQRTLSSRGAMSLEALQAMCEFPRWLLLAAIPSLPSELQLQQILCLAWLCSAESGTSEHQARALIFVPCLTICDLDGRMTYMLECFRSSTLVIWFEVITQS